MVQPTIAAVPQAKAKANKYHNTPTERVTASGAVLHFDSQKEARRYDVLAARLQAGQIRDLRLQVEFTLQEAYTDTEGRRVRAIRYKADFTYKERDAAEEAVAAGRTPVLTCKGSLMLWMKPPPM